MYNLALQEAIINRKPYIPSLDENTARKGFFERHEFLSMLSKLPEYLRPSFMFAYQFGWRIRSEVFPLRWEQIDLHTCTVRLEVGITKSKDGRLIYLTNELRAVFSAYWEQHLRSSPGCPWVFHRSGKRIFTCYKAWHRACREAGLIDRIPHDFRRTAVRNMVRSGIPERVAIQVAGHKTRSVSDRYHIVSDIDLQEAATRMESCNSPVLDTNLVTGTPFALGETNVSH